MDHQASSYLRFLPPVLWQDEPDSGFALGAALRVFEKLLSGIDDGVPILHTGADGQVREYAALAPLIAGLHRLYDPLRAPAAFLPWLATWVGLAPPAYWDDYQRRRAIADAAPSHSLRGVQDGLERALSAHAVSAARPRIAIDDGARLLSCTPRPGCYAPFIPLVSQGPVIRRDNTLVHGGLMRPTCIARAPDGTLYLGDAGTPTYWPADVDEAVWAVTPAGRYLGGGAPPLPQPLGPATWSASSAGAPILPRALAIDRAAPWNLYVLDAVTNGAQTALYRLPSPGFGSTTELATRDQLGLVSPVAMACDALGRLLILDAGGGGKPPAVVEVQPAPWTVTPHPLSQVLQPFSLAVLANGDLVVGDGTAQTAPTPAQLVRINRSGPAWSEQPLLAGSPPLVAPVAVLEFRPGLLLVLDAGLKPLKGVLGDAYTREIAEPAALYWADLGSSPPTLTRASQLHGLVQPTGMVSDGQSVFISDTGESAPGSTPRVPRAVPHEFGAAVHFSKQRLPSALERRRILGDISDAINFNKPAHTYWTMMSTF